MVPGSFAKGLAICELGLLAMMTLGKRNSTIQGQKNGS